MKHFMIITNNEKEKNVRMAEKLIRLIEGKGGSVHWTIMPAAADLSPVSVPADTEVILTIGGDGTLIRSAQRTMGSNVPLIGIKRGHLGYLCDLNEENLVPSIEALFEGKYETEERMMLTGRLTGEGVTDDRPYVSLNDIVLSSLNGQSVVHLTIHVNGTYLYAFNGDGIILATPTGSTAYNLSANGPIVEPKTALILMTPINPHTLNSRSIVLDPDDEISIRITPRRTRFQESAKIAFDGGHRHELRPGQELIVRRAEECASIIQIDKTNFLEKMKLRLQEI